MPPTSLEGYISAHKNELRVDHTKQLTSKKVHNPPSSVTLGRLELHVTAVKGQGPNH